MSHRFPPAGRPTYVRPWLEVHPLASSLNGDPSDLWLDYVVEYYMCQLCGVQYSTQSRRPAGTSPSDYPWIDSQTLRSFTEPCCRKQTKA